MSESLPVLKRLVIHPYGVRLEQTYAQLGAILDALEKFRINLFVEIGMREGGLATIMLSRMHYVLEFRYIGVELSAEGIQDSIRQQAEIIIGDCFSDDVRGQIGIAVHQTVGPALVFCDNGDKPRELSMYSQLLRIGDFIQIHDYPAEIRDVELAFLHSQFEEIEAEERRLQIGLPLYRRVRL